MAKTRAVRGATLYAESRRFNLPQKEADGDWLDAREALIARLAIARGLPLASTVGGGYGTDALEIARRHIRAILVLGQHFGVI